MQFMVEDQNDAPVLVFDAEFYIFLCKRQHQRSARIVTDVEKQETENCCCCPFSVIVFGSKG